MAAQMSQLQPPMMNGVGGGMPMAAQSPMLNHQAAGPNHMESPGNLLQQQNFDVQFWEKTLVAIDNDKCGSSFRHLSISPAVIRRKAIIKWLLFLAGRRAAKAKDEESKHHHQLKECEIHWRVSSNAVT
ncbi:hypothetical protein KR032_002736 [Drosophila birchii]|nr:hypothetical protein KR032_002736 [Drosophila birchii]